MDPLRVKLLTISEVGERLGKSKRWIQHRIADGSLTAYRVGRTPMIVEDSLRNVITPIRVEHSSGNPRGRYVG